MSVVEYSTNPPLVSIDNTAIQGEFILTLETLNPKVNIKCIISINDFDNNIEWKSSGYNGEGMYEFADPSFKYTSYEIITVEEVNG